VSEQIQDFPALHFDAKGLFSVKSSYEVHLDMKQYNVPALENRIPWKSSLFSMAVHLEYAQKTPSAV
jgi:hypothetical protein